MKETKVYVDELPESCKTCQFQCYGECRNGCDILKTDYSMTQCHIMRGKYKDCPLIDIKTHDREKDKRIKELEQKVQELQELDNKRAFRLYSVLYEQLEKEDCENVASRIDYLTGKDYSDICELYKTAKNIKQHDKELVAKVCEDIKDRAYENVGYHICECGKKFDIECIDFEDLCEIIDKIQKEFEDE